MGDQKDEGRMEFWSTIAGLMRRKRVFIPAVLVALTLGSLAYAVTPKTYVSNTTMVLTTTEYGSTERQGSNKPPTLTNPMLNFNESLTTTSAILIEVMNTKGVLEQLGATHGNTQLIVNDGRTNPNLLGLTGPFLYIEGHSVSADEAHRVVLDAQSLMKQKLNEYQNELNAPQRTYVSLVDVVPPTAPEASSGRATKLGVLAFLFGFLLCLGIAYGKHQIGARRRARADAAAADVGLTRPLGGGPEPVREPRPTRTPALVPGSDAKDDAEDDAVSTWMSDPKVRRSWEAIVKSTGR